MIKRYLHIGRRIMRRVLSSLLGALVVIIILAVINLNNRPDLSVWHKTVLDQEFTADSGLQNFGQYLELEDRLFDTTRSTDLPGSRGKGSTRHQSLLTGAVFPIRRRWPTNWNRSFVLPADKPAVGVLLLHGMSDSPYSLRSIGQLLQGYDAYVHRPENTRAWAGTIRTA